MSEGESFLDSLRVVMAPRGYQAQGFDCGEQDLTDYISDGTSASDELAGVSRSYLVLSDDDLVGYFTVLADSIQLDTGERPRGMRYTTAPALKLGRMGVNLSFKRRGVGYWILDYVVGMARDLSERIGLRYVTLDALKRDSLVTWYEGWGFVRNEGEPGRRIALLKDRKRWKAGDELHHVSMRFDILLEEETVSGP